MCPLALAHIEANVTLHIHTRLFGSFVWWIYCYYYYVFKDIGWQLPSFHEKPIKMCILRLSAREDSIHIERERVSLKCTVSNGSARHQHNSVHCNGIAIYWILKTDRLFHMWIWYCTVEFNIWIHTIFHVHKRQMHPINLLDSN